MRACFARTIRKKKPGQISLPSVSFPRLFNSALNFVYSKFSVHLDEMQHRITSTNRMLNERTDSKTSDTGCVKLDHPIFPMFGVVPKGSASSNIPGYQAVEFSSSSRCEADDLVHGNGEREPYTGFLVTQKDCAWPHQRLPNGLSLTVISSSKQDCTVVAHSFYNDRCTFLPKHVYYKDRIISRRGYDNTFISEKLSSIPSLSKHPHRDLMSGAGCSLPEPPVFDTSLEFTCYSYRGLDGLITYSMSVFRTFDGRYRGTTSYPIMGGVSGSPCVLDSFTLMITGINANKVVLTPLSGDLKRVNPSKEPESHSYYSSFFSSSPKTRDEFVEKTLSCSIKRNHKVAEYMAYLDRFDHGDPPGALWNSLFADCETDETYFYQARDDAKVLSDSDYSDCIRHYQGSSDQVLVMSAVSDYKTNSEDAKAAKMLNSKCGFEIFCKPEHLAPDDISANQEDIPAPPPEEPVDEEAVFAQKMEDCIVRHPRLSKILSGHFKEEAYDHYCSVSNQKVVKSFKYCPKDFKISTFYNSDLSLLKVCNPKSYRRKKLQYLKDSLAIEGINIDDRTSPDVLQRYRNKLAEILGDDEIEIDSVVLFVNYITDVDMSSPPAVPFGKVQIPDCGRLSVGWLDCSILECNNSDVVSFCKHYESILSYHELKTLNDLA
jgi:hypothetical protein